MSRPNDGAMRWPGALLGFLVIALSVLGIAGPAAAEQGAWSAAGSMAWPRDGHTATLLPGGRVLVVGGVDQGGYLPFAELYDPAANTWSAAASMSDARYFPTATLLGSGKVLVAGGFDGHAYLSSAELY